MAGAYPRSRSALIMVDVSVAVPAPMVVDVIETSKTTCAHIADKQIAMVFTMIPTAPGRCSRRPSVRPSVRALHN